MPWTAADAERHVKGLTPDQQRVWAAVANSALQRCEEAGEQDCDTKAIRQANATAKGAKESAAWLADVLDEAMGNEIEEALAERAVDGDYIALSEKAVRNSGEAEIKIIQPGWGSSGFYPADMLERDGPEVFKAGTKMYWNHQTAEEEAARPEGDLRNLAAELTTGARYLSNGPEGAGLYAHAKVFDAFKPAIEQLAPHIGVSIRALGQAKAGTAEGRKGPIIEKLVAAKSIDFVTEPGAGGQIVQLFESARGGREESQVDEKEARELKESVETQGKAIAALQESLKTVTEERDRLKEGSLLREAREIVVATLAESKLPEITRDRLAKSLGANPPLKDGALDRDELKKAVEAAVTEEIDYLTKVAGSPVRGMNSSDGGDRAVVEESTKRLEDSFRSMGLSESAAKVAALGRS